MPMKMRVALCPIIFLSLQFAVFAAAPANDVGWQPAKTWLFVVGALSWKHKETFGSFPVKNRRDAALVDCFKKAGVPETQIVYLQEKQAKLQRIDAAFKTQLKKL